MRTSNLQGRARKLYLVVLLTVIVVVSVQLAAYYNFERFFSPNSGTSRGSGNRSGTNITYIEVDTFINYGNNTANWSNDSKVPLGWNFFNLTLFLAKGNVNATWYPSFKEHFINAINGVTADSSHYWSLWVFCRKDQAWALSVVGADDIALSNNQGLAWYLISYTGNGPPVPGEKTVPACST